MCFCLFLYSSSQVNSVLEIKSSNSFLLILTIIPNGSFVVRCDRENQWLDCRVLYCSLVLTMCVDISWIDSLMMIYSWIN